MGTSSIHGGLSAKSLLVHNCLAENAARSVARDTGGPVLLMRFNAFHQNLLSAIEPKDDPNNDLHDLHDVDLVKS